MEEYEHIPLQVFHLEHYNCSKCYTVLVTVENDHHCQLLALTCGHLYCGSCLDDLLETGRECLVCNYQIDHQQMVVELFIDQSVDEKKEPGCAICLDGLVDPAFLRCGHTFCWPCIYGWLRKSRQCPNCRLETGPPLPLYTGKKSSDASVNVPPRPEPWTPYKPRVIEQIPIEVDLGDPAYWADIFTYRPF